MTVVGGGVGATEDRSHGTRQVVGVVQWERHEAGPQLLHDGTPLVGGFAGGGEEKIYLKLKQDIDLQKIKDSF